MSVVRVFILYGKYTWWSSSQTLNPLVMSATVCTAIHDGIHPNMMVSTRTDMKLNFVLLAYQPVKRFTAISLTPGQVVHQSVFFRIATAQNSCLFLIVHNCPHTSNFEYVTLQFEFVDETFLATL